MKISSTILFILYSIWCFGQLEVEGFVFESGNRGYIANANVTFYNSDGSQLVKSTNTDASGTYILNLPEEGTYIVSIQLLPFIDHSESVEIDMTTSRTYLKHEIIRKPGYIFEITLSEKDIDPNAAKNGLHGALIEVYNNTTKTEELVIVDLQSPEFKVNFVKGNHYTILVRKDGFLSKRMEAFVDVEGCILCFEGIGDITPGVSDNLTESNSMGVLLSNVEMDRYFEGKVIGLKDIYYETDKSKVTKKGAVELDKIQGFLRDNPELSMELGAHTDSRGKAKYNLELSKKRAEAAVDYLTSQKKVEQSRIYAQGYGESQPTNKCIDGVKCTELEHARNRRTELKILAVVGDHQRRSLRQMKADELLDEILQEISDEGQIRISDDTTIEEVLANKNEKTSVTTSSSLQNVIKESDQVTIETKTMLREPDNMFTSKSDIDISEKEPVNIITKDVDRERYSNTYSGYKIVLHFSRFELSQDHPLFEKFSDLDVYSTADGNKLYMIESHHTRKSAEDRLRSRFISSFPTAYVIGFENGIITD